MTAAFMACPYAMLQARPLGGDQRSRAIAAKRLAIDLVGAGERQLRHEDDAARMLVGGRVVEGIPLDLVLGQTCALGLGTTNANGL